MTGYSIRAGNYVMGQLLGDLSGALQLVHCEDPENPDGGEALSWTDWQEDQVIAPLEDEAAGYMVARVDGVESNADPLSRWECSMDVFGTMPSGIGPNIVLAINASWRTEIVDERGLFTMDPIPASGWTGTMFSLQSSCEYEFGGTFEDGNYIYEYPEGANQGTLPVCLNGTVTLKPDPGIASFQIVVAGEAVVLKTDKDDPEAGPQPDQIQVSVGLIFETAR